MASFFVVFYYISAYYKSMESKASSGFKRFLDFIRSQKFLKFFFPCLYLALAIGICATSAYVFSSTYYTTIFVSGTSMLPTLVGGTVDSNLRNHYGISDNSKAAINNLNRFDVIVTYYPWTKDDDVYKIKRIWGLPGETISLTYNDTAKEYTFQAYKNDKLVNEYKSDIKEMSFDLGGSSPFVSNVTTFKDGTRTFHTRLGSYRQISSYTLQKDEYFVMGDNWGGSTDCYTKNIEEGSSIKLTKKFVQGKVVAIEGTAKYNASKKALVDKRPFKRMYNF